MKEKEVSVSDLKKSSEKIMVFAENTTKQSLVLFGLVVRPGMRTRTPLLRSQEEWVKQSTQGFKFFKAGDTSPVYITKTKKDFEKKENIVEIADGVKVNKVEGEKDAGVAKEKDTEKDVTKEKDAEKDTENTDGDADIVKEKDTEKDVTKEKDADSGKGKDDKKKKDAGKGK